MLALQKVLAANARNFLLLPLAAEPSRRKLVECLFHIG